MNARLRNVLLAIGSSMLAFLIEVALWKPIYERIPFSLFFVVVAIAALSDGPVPACAAMACGIGFSRPLIGGTWPAYLISVADFTVISSLVVYLAGRRFRMEKALHREIAVRRNAEAALVQSERRLRITTEAAEAGSKAKDHFLAILSHELRTPLTPVLGLLSILGDDDKMPERYRDDLATMQRNVELETRLIDDLLDLTRISQGKLQFQRERIDAHELIRQTVRVIGGDVTAKELRISLDLEAREYHVDADPTRLQQVFWNVMKNAVKFTGHGGRIAIRSLDSPEGRLRVEVSDDGIGMEPTALSGIFNPFDQGSESIGRRFGGLGLGLTITKSLVDAHGGSMTAASEGAGKGSTFVIDLPVVAAGPAPASFAAEAAPARRRQARILLVEDHEPTAAVVARLLQKRGHEVETARTCAEALGAATRSQFDLLVSDLGLPDGSGTDLMRRLKDQYSLAGIALSGYGMEQDLENSRVAGFSAHLIKPVEITQLDSLIQEFAGPGAKAAADGQASVSVPRPGEGFIEPIKNLAFPS